VSPLLGAVLMAVAFFLGQKTEQETAFKTREIAEAATRYYCAELKQNIYMAVDSAGANVTALTPIEDLCEISRSLVGRDHAYENCLDLEQYCGEEIFRWQIKGR